MFNVSVWPCVSMFIEREREREREREEEPDSPRVSAGQSGSAASDM